MSHGPEEKKDLWTKTMINLVEPEKKKKKNAVT